MKYRDGQTMKLGDRVQLWGDKFGGIVCIIADGLFSDEFPEANWAFLKNGLLIKLDDGQQVARMEPSGMRGCFLRTG